MEIPSNVLDSLANAVTPQDARSVLVLKTALDNQTQAAAALLEALPKPTRTGLPEHIGNTVNTTA